MSPRYSIIVPAFNEEEWLARSLPATYYGITTNGINEAWSRLCNYYRQIRPPLVVHEHRMGQPRRGGHNLKKRDEIR